MSFALQGIFIVIPIYMQSVLGMSALQSGLTVAPMSLTAAILAPVAGRLSDRFGGKYLLMAGLAIFGVGTSIVTLVASASSTSATFILPWIVAGVGLGLVFAPMTTVAMQDIKPAMAGAASGVLNTTRQLGAVIGAAVIGAVLQNQLASSLHDQAVASANQLPGPFRAQFVDGFAKAAKSGLQVGRGQTGASLPTGLPAQVAARIGQLIHDVFVSGYITAMRPTVAVAVGVLTVASLSCLLVINRRAPAQTAAVPPAEIAVA